MTGIQLVEKAVVPLNAKTTTYFRENVTEDFEKTKIALGRGKSSNESES